jgi:hypothetical protein
LELFLCLTSAETSQSASKTNILCLGSVRSETDNKISKRFDPVHTVTKPERTLLAPAYYLLSACMKQNASLEADSRYITHAFSRLRLKCQDLLPC